MFSNHAGSSTWKTFLSDSGVLLHCDLSNSKNNSVMAQLQMIIVY